MEQHECRRAKVRFRGWGVPRLDGGFPALLHRARAGQLEVLLRGEPEALPGSGEGAAWGALRRPRTGVWEGKD